MSSFTPSMPGVPSRNAWFDIPPAFARSAGDEDCASVGAKGFRVGLLPDAKPGRQALSYEITPDETDLFRGTKYVDAALGDPDDFAQE